MEPFEVSLGESGNGAGGVYSGLVQNLIGYPLELQLRLVWGERWTDIPDAGGEGLVHYDTFYGPLLALEEAEEVIQVRHAKDGVEAQGRYRWVVRDGGRDEAESSESTGVEEGKVYDLGGFGACRRVQLHSA